MGQKTVFLWIYRWSVRIMAKSEATFVALNPVPDSALLYAAPSNAHTETILVRNAGTEAVSDVYVSHRERYVPLERHVELVNSIEPKYISRIDFNETAEVRVNFAVPHF